MLLLPARCEYGVDQVYHADLFSLCAGLSSQSVDMILCDLPYGTTACHWDTVIPFAPMWEAFKRIIKPRGAVVLTASQPFTSALVMSNPTMFRYEWIWEKPRASGYPSAGTQPLRAHENVLVFSCSYCFGGLFAKRNQNMNYFPVFAHKQKPYRKIGTHGAQVYLAKSLTNKMLSSSSDGKRYPRSVVKIDNSNRNRLHPTQKPVALFEYLIRTYTHPGDLVVDPCVGSGTTAVAARNTDRHFICGDYLAEWVNVARHRLATTDPYQHRELAPNVTQLSLFEAV